MRAVSSRGSRFGLAVILRDAAIGTITEFDMALFALATVFLAVAVGYPWLPGTGELSSWLPTSALCFVVSVALFLRQPWSQHLLFGLAVSYGVTWPATIAAIAWTRWPYPDDPIQSVVSLVPGLLWLGFWLGMYLLVRAQFRQPLS
jgi:hypothetical protein